MLPKGYQLVLVPSELDVKLLLSSPCCNGFLLSSSRFCDSCGTRVRDSYARDKELTYQCKASHSEEADSSTVAEQAADWYEDLLLCEVNPLSTLLLRQEMGEELAWLRTQQLEAIRSWARDDVPAAQESAKLSWRDWWRTTPEQRSQRRRQHGYRAAFSAEERAWHKLVTSHQAQFKK